MTEATKNQSSKINFSTYVMSLASAALIEMGIVADPLTKEKRTNRTAARQHIDVLEMLKEKSVGNLSPEERELIERALTDLKLQFSKDLNSK